ncbi:MAG: hypothetical protein ACRC45_06005 [Cetobacterium sp.]
MSEQQFRNVTNHVPGNPTVNTVGQMFPNNAPNRPNYLNGQEMGNTPASFPKDINQGLQKQ